MRYALITFKDKTQKAYVMEEFRLTRGFAKIINSTYGNVAIPIEDILEIDLKISQ